MLRFITLIFLQSARGANINFLAPGSYNFPADISGIFYADPLAAQAAADAEAEAEREAKPLPVQLDPSRFITAAPFVFPHLHVQKAPPEKTDLVSTTLCKKLQDQIGAMKCSLVTYISGVPEGCECQLEKSSCPPFSADLGFTGLSASDSINLPQMGDISVILCMYWQWKERVDTSAEDRVEHLKSIKRTKQLVKDAMDAATANSGVVAKGLWALTPTPWPEQPA